jgi:hypothetical protein
MMSEIGIKVKALVSIKNGRTWQMPGSVFPVSEKDFDYLNTLNPPRVIRITDDSSIDEVVVVKEEKSFDLSLIDGCSEEIAEKLIKAGYSSSLLVAIADLKNLSKIDGISKGLAKTLIKNAQSLNSQSLVEVND